MKIVIMLTCFMLVFGTIAMNAQEDPYLWLEDVQGQKSLDWVKKHNKKSTDILEKIPGFEEMRKKILSIYNADTRIAYPSRKGEYLYNFRRNAQHPRGIYRRTTLQEYKKKEPKWELILDIDELAKKEKENWVYKGMNFLKPDYKRALVKLSRGGADAVVVREFDVESRTFLKDGFQFKEAKSSIDWIDKDTLFVGTDFGKDSLSDSGYPRIVKVLKRGQPLEKAKTVFEASKKSVGAGGNRVYSHDGSFCLVSDMISFYEQILYIYENDKLAKIDIPSDAEFENYFKKQIILKLKSDWKVGDTTYKQGSIIIGKLADIKAGKKVFKVLMEEGERFSISSVTTTRNYILVTVLDNVVSKLFRLAQDAKGNWKKEEVKIKDNISLTAFNTSKMDDDYYVTYENFLNPDSLHFMDGKTEKLEKLKGRPHYFDSTPYKIEQYEAVSKDGVKVPYFVVMRKDIKLNGRNPALVYGYGGFMVSETPFYSSHTGLYWLEKGGVYVLTNIRGGGEFGPKWHQAALLKNRMKSYEDFIAIGEDVVKRKITSPGKMAMEGGSNGGLLVGAVAVLRPDLFKGVLCAVPLLDMKRYHKLLAGASWMAEYGNPDKPDMWNYIKTYSPYHNLKKGVKYPEIFFYTSTRDDRVHPAHARKMAARMEEMGMPFYYYENMEGGHAGAANYNQRAYMRALNYAYLYKLLMGK